MSTNPPVPPTPPQQGAPQYGAPQPPKKTGLSTAGLVLGIIGVVFAFIPMIGMPVAIIAGVLALLFGIIGIVKKHGGKAIASTILGIAAIVVAIIATTTIYGAAKSISDAASSLPAATSSTTAGSTAAGQKTVTMKATATGNGTVVWGLDTGTNTEQFSGTWTKDIQAAPGKMITVSVTGDYADGDSQKMTCEIDVDGVSKKTGEGSGAAGSASCSVFGV
ncbi:Protein of unknown function [Propionibacterium freudenreichii]|nr:Protein of unknown function [Propionibacterium freudenreichii]